MDIPPALELIVEDIAREKGTAYLVGGSVIDLIQEGQVKDWDVEVYGMSYEQLQSVLSIRGTPILVGQNFGVITMMIDETPYDFSIPRLEVPIGVGHKDFDITLVPEASIEEATYRRDLTMNAILVNLHDSSVADPYNGMQDLERGVLRHVSERFAEDPLRVLRVMQLLARKGKEVAPETIELSKSLSHHYDTIPKERVFEEWSKLLLKSEKPSMGLQFLDNSGWIAHYPELHVLQQWEQNPEHHPEGNVWTHSLLAVDAAASYRDKIPTEWQLGYMFGMLLHDVGKAKTTKPDFTAHGHDEAGVPIAHQFMKKMGRRLELTDQVSRIVKYHMRPVNLINNNSRDIKWVQLNEYVPLQVMAYVSRADHLGGRGYSDDTYHEHSEKMFEMIEKMKNPEVAKTIEPILTGRDLIEAGYPPGPDFKAMLGAALDAQIDGGVVEKAALYDIAVGAVSKL